MNNYPLIGAIEAGGTKFVCAVGYFQCDLSLPKNRINIATEGDPLVTMNKVCDWFALQQDTLNSEICAFGVVSFGPICLSKDHSDYGHITTTPKNGWEHFNILGEIRNRFLNPIILFDTDVNGAAFGEYMNGNAIGLSDFIYITIGTGIGVGGMVNGQLLHGAMHSELGHMKIPRIINDPYKGCCPYHGDCWEGLCSGHAMYNRTGIPAHQIPPDDVSWSYEIQYVSTALTNIIFAFSPKRIILGGGVSKAGKLGASRFFSEIHREVLSQINGYLPIDRLTNKSMSDYIVAPSLGPYSGIFGAFHLAATHPLTTRKER